MNTSRTKPGVAFRATVGLVVVLVGYPLSFGPAYWRADADWKPVPAVYRPLEQLSYRGPKLIKRPLRWWVSLGKERRSSDKKLIRLNAVD